MSLILSVSLVLAQTKTTSVDLYRLGNASSSRMDNVRDQDVTKFTKNGVVWVKSRSGGISTFSSPSNQKNEWKLSKGASYPDGLFLNNDKGTHWQWEPSSDMSLDDYTRLLQQVGNKFLKIS
jgi:hypothetical protein